MTGTIEDREVVRFTADVERAVAGARYAGDLLADAVVRARVEAGLSWEDLAELLVGRRSARESIRRQYGEDCAQYAAGLWVTADQIAAGMTWQQLLAESVFVDRSA